MSWLQIAEMIRILKNSSGCKMQLARYWLGSSHLRLLTQKSNFLKSYCYPIYGCALWRHSFQNSIRKLTVSYSDTFKRLINVPRYTSSSLAFPMNATDHINVVLHKFADSLMSRVVAPQTVLLLPLSIAMHVISLHWWISGRVCYMYRSDHRQNYPSICQRVMNDLVSN